MSPPHLVILSLGSVDNSVGGADDWGMLHALLGTFWVTAGSVLILAFMLSGVRRAGGLGMTISEALCRAPLVDLLVAVFTWVPWVVAAVLFGWAGFLGALLGQAVALGVWCVGHELLHLRSARGPRIVKFINRTVGRWRNHAALWVTLIALPGFWFIRILQVICYPFLIWLLKFPRYTHADWVNVSRHKFEGLVGHDLVWCLYCDWMTGVYALGAEMLRNVESFWCPIRFYDGKKCENCKLDFPDVNNGWVPANYTMRHVVDVMEEKYGRGERSWFGHPVRLTVRGQAVDASPQPTISTE